MKVKFVKSALTIAGMIESGQVVEVNALDRGIYVRAGLAVDFSEPEKATTPKRARRKVKQDGNS